MLSSGSLEQNTEQCLPNVSLAQLNFSPSGPAAVTEVTAQNMLWRADGLGLLREECSVDDARLLEHSGGHVKEDQTKMLLATVRKTSQAVP